VIGRRISLDFMPIYWKSWSRNSAIISIKLIFKICRFSADRKLWYAKY